MSPARKFIIDCDPGVDDAIALFLAFAQSGDHTLGDTLPLLGITTVAGNVDASLTARNARLIRELAGRADVPVYAGAQQPLVRSAVAASHFHGESGLGSLTINEPRQPLADGHAVQFIIDSLIREPAGCVTLLVMGPMTNIAMAMRLAPQIVPRIGEIVFMGGARLEGGNITASAEYNIHADPHAAHIVCSAACRRVAIGLDATHQVRATPNRVRRLRAIATPAATAVVQLVDFCNRLEANTSSADGSPLHDPCVVAWALRPQLFRTVACQLRVECTSELTLGHTAVEFRASVAAQLDTLWVTHVDADGVFDLLASALRR